MLKKIRFEFLGVIFALTVILISSFLPVQAATTDLYVATNGNDSNAGTITAPFLTLAKAQAQVRTLLPSASGPINVWVRGGTYYLSSALTFGTSDSATSTAPVTFSNYNGEKVVISGGLKVTSGWSTHSGNIMKTNIGANKAVDLLFLNGAQQIMARYPNFDSSKVYLDGYASDAISTSRAARWANPSTGYIRALHSSMWGGNDYKITGKDGGNNIQYTWVGDNNRGNGMHGLYRMVENLFEELDAPGEWFYNKSTGDLYFYPPGGTNLGSSTIELASLEELIKVAGNSSSKVKYLTFSGLNFTHVKRTLFSRTFEGLLRGDWTIVRAGTVYIQDAENIAVKNCKFDQVGGNGVFMSGYNRNHLIDNNDFIDTGATCVQVVGLMSACRYPSTWSNHHTDIADTTTGPLTGDYPQNITISNNYMYNMGRFEKQSAGVNISMSESVTVQHNTIHRSPRSGININDGTFGGHIIEYNDVFDCVRESGDHGPFNSWGRDRFWSYLGYDTNGNNGAAKYPYRELDAYKTTIIRNNRFHYSKVSEWGIDLDDGSSNYQIYNNLCLNTGFKLREGFDRHVYNNIIVNQCANIHCTYEDAYNNVEKNIFITGTPISFANSDTNREVRGHSHFDYNVFWNKDGAISLPSGWNSSGFDTHSITTDPKFRYTGANDYTVTNATALQTGFVNFPMDQFGRAGCPTPPPISNDPPVITSDPEPLMGATVTSVDAGAQSVAGLPDMNGVFFITVPSSSHAYTQGFRANDVIRSVNGTNITTKASFWAIYNPLAPDSTVNTTIYRNQMSQAFSFKKISGTETLNDTSGVTYTGSSWGVNGAAQGAGSCFNSDLHAATTNGDSFSFTFNGSGIDFITETYTDEGNVDIYIDNVLQKTVSCVTSSRLFQQTVYSNTSLSSGIHTIKGVKKDGSYMIVDAFKVYSNTAPTVTPTPTPTTGPRSAYSQIEAESYDSQSGIQAESCGEGGQNIGYIENGDYVVYNNIDFGSGATGFQARVASATSGGNIEIRLDGITGALVGTCSVAGTGGWQNWVTRTCNVSGASGTHNLYLRFTGGSGYLFNMNWFQFSRENVTPTPSATTTPTPPTATPTPTPTPVGSYVRFRNVATGLYIDGMGSTANGSNACQWGNSSSNNQQWKIISSGSYVMIQNRATGLYLDGMGRTSNGSICGQWGNSGSNAQQWTQESVGSYVKFKNRQTGLYLDGMGSTSNGSNLCQWSSSSSTNQQWQIQ